MTYRTDYARMTFLRSVRWTTVALGLAAGLWTGALPVRAADRPFLLEKSMTIPDVPVGPYSASLALDLAGERIFSTPQAAKAVAVTDLNTGRVVKMLPVGNPHGLFFSPTLGRLFVTDGAAGDLKVFSGKDYSLIKTIRLTVGTDVLAFDPKTQFIYANNGGGDAGIDHGIVSVIDTVKMEKVVDIPSPAPDLEGSIVDSAKQLLYVEGESWIDHCAGHLGRTCDFNSADRRLGRRHLHRSQAQPHLCVSWRGPY
jgi:hypothetical protein